MAAAVSRCIVRHFGKRCTGILGKNAQAKACATMCQQPEVAQALACAWSFYIFSTDQSPCRLGCLVAQALACASITILGNAIREHTFTGKWARRYAGILRVSVSLKL